LSCTYLAHHELEGVNIIIIIVIAVNSTVIIGMAGPSADMMFACRPELCFWNSVVLYFTLILAAAQVLATALNTYFQLTIMLMILMIGVTALAHFQPFMDPLLQRMQVNRVTLFALSLQHCLSSLSLHGLQ